MDCCVDHCNQWPAHYITFIAPFFFSPLFASLPLTVVIQGAEGGKKDGEGEAPARGASGGKAGGDDSTL